MLCKNETVGEVYCYELKESTGWVAVLPTKLEEGLVLNLRQV